VSGKDSNKFKLQDGDLACKTASQRMVLSARIPSAHVAQSLAVILFALVPSFIPALARIAVARRFQCLGRQAKRADLIQPQFDVYGL